MRFPTVWGLLVVINMSKNRMINTKFWSDNWVVELDPLERYLFLYFLTNEHTNICGIYELPLRVMSFESGIDKEMLAKMLPRFQPKIYYLDGWIYIKNFLKHQKASGNVKLGIENGQNAVPKQIMALIKGIDNTPPSQVEHSPKLELESELELEHEVGKPTSIKYEPKDMELSELLLSLIRNNTPTIKQPNLDKWAEQIRLAREQDGRTYEQIKFVIEWSQKSIFWQANILSTKKLREKFDTLVAQIKRDKSQSKWHILSS